MERIPEPEVMSGEEQSEAYALADFSESNRLFVDKLTREFSMLHKDVLDIGCGPADVDIRLAKREPSVNITAVDASDAMLNLAKDAVEKAGLGKRITLVKGYVPGVRLDKKFDVIISKDMLHHVPDPMTFWEEIKRLSKGGTAFYLMDLFRPETTDEAKRMVETASGNWPEILKRDFYNSLLAAFTVEEVKEQLLKAGLELDVEKISERHFIAKGSL